MNIAYTRTIDQNGRIGLPIEVLRALDINFNEYLEIFVGDDGRIYLAKTKRIVNENIRSKKKK